MFTGIITDVGTVQQAARTPDGLELTIATSYPDLEPGESVAVDGACLTVQGVAPNAFTAHIIRTSLDRTRFSEYVVGQRVNLERALRAGDRLGGHLVQGHVDGVGTVERVTQRDDARLLDVRVPDEVARVSIPLGSITVDGVSLTVARCADDSFTVALIPHTLSVTTLGTRAPGARENLEIDLSAKYVEQLMLSREEAR